MWQIYVIVIICICTCSQSLADGKLDTSVNLPKQNSTIEKKHTWNIKLDIFFKTNLSQVTEKKLGSDVEWQCHAVMNFTKVQKVTQRKEKTEVSRRELPERIVQNLMQNVKVYWLKDDRNIKNTHRLNVSTEIDSANGTIITQLSIRNVSLNDQGNYSCIIKQNHQKKQTTRLEVISNEAFDTDMPTFASLFPDSLLVSGDKVPEDIRSTDSTIPQKPAIQSKLLEPICQEYVGKVCAQHLKGHFVYIPFNTTQESLEERLLTAIQVTRYSNEISSNCEGYALPSLCYSTFPICRDHHITNENFFDEARKVFSLNTTDDGDTYIVVETPQVSHPGIRPEMFNDTVKQMFDFRFNSTVLRRVCKEECIILENELCQTEYAIAKRHPQIGRQLTLEKCHDLPEDDQECLKIGIGSVMVSDDECYWENGSGYLGRVGVANNGLTCIEWFKQLHVKVSNYPELAGRHSYCRNPGGLKEQPWCVVEKDGKTEKLFCDIPKCAHKIWLYIVVVFILLSLTILGFTLCFCYRGRNKNCPENLGDINLPSADKNIYGNSRMNSPIEMNDLLSTQGCNNQPHLTRPVRGNGALRVPQYSLSQIKFLEELGEGAFGKVYKGALKIGGETQYVAVKALKENASTKTQADFRREIDLISELRHDNIVCIVGVALREEPLCMLFEFMARGDLHEFLMGRAPPSGKGLPPMRLLHIANNIASGMHYLASHHYVHRDLAARNCLVSDDFVVKISDFGLSRDIYSSDYYRVQSKSLLPVRWMPPESILYGKFTTESDIWSYGVVLWEIYSYGLQPYYGYSNQEVISMVRAGELLAPPASCPGLVYGLMRDCWRHTPQQRPKFDEIVERIQSWVDQGGCPEPAMSECSTSRRQSTSNRELQERVPLLPPHFSSSNGSLATGSLKKFSVAGSSSRVDDNCSTCSEVPPLAPKKKGSSGSLIDSDKARDTVVRIQNAQFGNEI